VGPSDQGGSSIFAETTLAGEWSRLVRLCTQLTGSSQAAEDLAQETLYEAWRHRDRVHDPQGQVSWHNAIARNVCLRWRTLRLREGTVKVQAHRARLALHQILETQFREEAAAYGLVAPEAVRWQTTRIWCPLCGQRHLEGQLDVVRGDFLLQCPSCAAEMGAYTAYTSMPAWFRGVSGFKPALNRVMHWVNTYYQPVLRHLSSPGTFCGWSRALQPSTAEALPETQHHARGMLVCCAPCDQGGTMRLSNLVLYLPQAWKFWRDHPRLRLLEEQLVEHQGRAALVTGFRSMTEPVQLDVVLAQQTYEVLSIQPSSDVYHLRSRTE
jgi:hypothetical protein